MPAIRSSTRSAWKPMVAACRGSSMATITPARGSTSVPARPERSCASSPWKTRWTGVSPFPCARPSPWAARATASCSTAASTAAPFPSPEPAPSTRRWASTRISPSMRRTCRWESRFPAMARSRWRKSGPTRTSRPSGSSSSMASLPATAAASRSRAASSYPTARSRTTRRPGSVAASISMAETCAGKTSPSRKIPPPRPAVRWPTIPRRARA